MEYKVLVLDIDGTLNNSKHKISKETKKALRKAQESGVLIVLASGRPNLGLNYIAEELEFSKYGGYTLAFNGGIITDYKTNEVIYEKSILPDSVKKIYDISKEFDLNVVTYSEDSVIMEKVDEYVGLELDICRVEGNIVDSIKEYVDFAVPKCMITGKGEYIEKVEPLIQDKLGEGFNVFRSQAFFLEIMPEKIDKAYSLSKLLEHLNLTKNEMIACGDGFNDISMISYAGLGVAMKNAENCVKEVADYITLSNDDNGIAHVVEKFILEEDKLYA